MNISIFFACNPSSTISFTFEILSVYVMRVRVHMGNILHAVSTSGFENKNKKGSNSNMDRII